MDSVLGSTRWRKVLRDLTVNPSRTLLAIFAIAIGIFGVGSILTAYAILNREVQVNYANTHPASAILYVEGTDRALAADVERLPGIAAAEPRRVIWGRFATGEGEWRPLMLMAVDNFQAMKLATFTSDTGAATPADGEILIERSSLMDQGLGDRIVVRTPKGVDQELLISGIVHDAAQSPGWQDRVAYGYVTLDTLASLGESPGFNELRILVSEDATDVAHITTVAYQVKDYLEGRGYTVSTVSVPEPGQHPHTDQMNSLLFLFEAFGVLALILSAILVSNIVSSLLTEQIRQIGAMKAVGARTGQIAGLYFGAVLIFGLAGLVVGIPLGQWAGTGYAAFTLEMLNFDLTSRAIPAWVYAVQIAVGLTVPLLAAALPVLRGSRITVRQAISDYGIGEQGFNSTWIDRLVTRINFLNRPLLLSLRNTFRRKGRLALTVGILAMGGATFMSAINVGESWSNTIDVAMQARHYDLEVRFARPYPAADVNAVLKDVPGIAQTEDWEQMLAVQEHPDGTDGLRFYANGLPSDSDVLSLPVIAGRWLQPGDTDAIVVNHELALDPETNFGVGNRITLRIGNRLTDWTVVGIVREIGAPRRGLGTAASAYVPLDTLAQVTSLTGMTTNLRIRTTQRDDTSVNGVLQALEQRFDTAGMERTAIQTTPERARVLQEHLVVIVAFLMVMALLVAAVGSLALVSAMSISVMERTREIGVIRVIGASSGDVLRNLIVEGLMIGILSWLVAVLLSSPATLITGGIAGQIFIRSDLNFVFPASAVAGWLGLTVLISVAASAYPAWGATRLTVRDVLAYE